MGRDDRKTGLGFRRWWRQMNEWMSCSNGGKRFFYLAKGLCLNWAFINRILPFPDGLKESPYIRYLGAFSFHLHFFFFHHQILRWCQIRPFLFYMFLNNPFKKPEASELVQTLATPHCTACATAPVRRPHHRRR